MNSEIPSLDELFPISQEDKSSIHSIIARLSIREKIPQMVFPHVTAVFRNKDDEDYKRVIRFAKEKKVGGFAFFKGTVFDYSILSNELQQISEIPLILAADFERGTAMRVEEATSFPYAMALAATQEVSLAKRMGIAIATESKALGIHNNYAPVADINTNSSNPIVNIRAFSDDKETVAKFAIAYMHGLQNEKIIATVKHFPGHGRTDVDSHRELPIINCSKEELYTEELFPFIELIKNGIQSIMVGHLAVPAIDTDSIIPATFSKRIVTDILKEELGFNGLIVTDALNMFGATNDYSVAEAARLSVQAGVDILLMPPDCDIAIDSLVNAVTDGMISEDRINESVRKILFAKKYLGLWNRTEVNLSEVRNVIASKKHIELSQQIADASITIAKQNNLELPIADGKTISIITLTDIIETELEASFQNYLKAEREIKVSVFINKEINENKIGQIIDIAKTSDVIIVPLFFRIRAYQGEMNLSLSQFKLIEALNSLNAQKIFISFGDPYIIKHLPAIDNYLCTYGDSKISQYAVVKGLLGKIKFTGKLPIEL
jgi:beta-N-acetylhexosaminidase